MTAPFSPGSVSVGLHPDTGVTASEQAAQVVAEAVAAEAAGFDGVTLSEHHAGFPGYLPQPLLAVNWILAAVPRVWAAPAPVLLGLRSPYLVAEELAWTAARFPGRVAAAVAAGYAEADHAALRVSTAGRTERFVDQVDALLSVTDGDDPLAADPAIGAGLIAATDLLLAVNSRGAARRAAGHGMGMLFPGGQPADRLAVLSAEYRRAGGTGPIVGIAVIWLGSAERSSPEADAVYRAAAQPGMWQADGFAVGTFSGDPQRVGEALATHASAAGMTAINLRFRSDGASSAHVVAQLEMAGAELVPIVRSSIVGGLRARPEGVGDASI